MGKKSIKDGVCTVEKYLSKVGETEIDFLSSNTLAGMIDHTLLKPEATKDDIKQLCQEAKEHKFKSVCINPHWVKTAAKLLQKSKVKICTVIGFPLGATTSSIKAKEASEAIKNGASEIDMVINIGLLKSGNQKAFKKDIEKLVQASKGSIVKVILETCLLSEEEIALASKIAKAAGADFVKTSTGFSSSGASVEAVKIMRNTVGEALGVKASGGIKDRTAMLEMIKAGATRIGASAGIAIISDGVEKPAKAQKPKKPAPENKKENPSEKTEEVTS